MILVIFKFKIRSQKIDGAINLSHWSDPNRTMSGDLHSVVFDLYKVQATNPLLADWLLFFRRPIL